MRIISGRAKGRRLASPRGSHIRPVLDQVKESVFNILFNVSNLEVLDIFAGTGSVGLEAVSRGARGATFVENDREALELLRENILRCKFENECRIIPLHVGRALKKLIGSKFDLIFIDPPYLKNLVNPTILKVANLNLLEKNGKIVIEHHPKEKIGESQEGLEIIDERKYGQTLITFLSTKS